MLANVGKNSVKNVAVGIVAKRNLTGSIVCHSL